MTERKPPGMSFGSWVDAQIARGLARGDFDDLPGAGKPLPRSDREETAYDWAVAKARREGIETAAMLPPGLALRRERELLPERAAALPAEAAVRALAEDFDDRVRSYWSRPHEGPVVPVGLCDVEALVAHWRSTRPPPAPPPAPPPPPGAAPRRRWWRRRPSG